MKIIIKTLLLCLLLTSCGFQLRGTADTSISYNKIYLSLEQVQLRRALTTALAQNNIQISSRNEAEILLFVFQVKQNKTEMSIDANANSFDIRLNYSLSYQFKDVDGGEILASGSLNEKDTYRATQVNSDYAQEQQIYQQLADKLAFRLVQQLSLIPRNDNS